MRKIYFFLVALLGFIQSLAQSGIISTVAGNGTSASAGDGGPATAAEFIQPEYVAVDGLGNIYVTDYWSNKIRKINTSGIISTFAGSGISGYSGDGSAASAAKLNQPIAIATDKYNNLYIADLGNNVVRKVSTSGIITTVAGNDTMGYSGDGHHATRASLSRPIGVAVDYANNIYIADANNYVIRKVDTAGVIHTVAGNGSWGYSGDGGPASAAQLTDLNSVTVDQNGNVYIPDYTYNVIREINTSGIINTIMGTGLAGFSGDGGMASAATFSYPSFVYVDQTDNIYITDFDNNVIRKVDNLGIIHTVAGNHTLGYSGDGGAATLAALHMPGNVVTDGAGNMYIADVYNYRIRKVTGVTTLCVGSTATLSFDTSSGHWYSRNDAIATVDSVHGVVTGISSGTDTMTYSFGSGYLTTLVDVRDAPRPITGLDSAFCMGIALDSSLFLSDTTPYGIWSSSNPGVAIIDPITGDISLRAQGSDTITYTTGCGSPAKKALHIYPPSPSAITITHPSCSNLYYYTFAGDSISGVPGEWTHYRWDFGDGTGDTGRIVSHTFPTSYANYNVKLIDSIIDPHGCYNRDSVNNPVYSFTDSFYVNDTFSCGEVVFKGPLAFMGDTSLPYSQYIWHFGDGVVAMSATSRSAGHGYLSHGLYADTLIVKDRFGCYDTISGMSNTGVNRNRFIHIGGASGGYSVTPVYGCAPLSVTFVDTSRDICPVVLRKWVLNSTPFVVPSSFAGGAITYGIASDTIVAFPSGDYTIEVVDLDSIGCNTDFYYSIHSAPTTADTIIGPGVLCVGTSFHFYDSSAGGRWHSSDTGIIKIDSITGIATSIGAGVDTIRYRSGCGGASATKIVTVNNTVPDSITVVPARIPVTVCAGSSIEVYDSMAGGMWSVNDTTICRVNDTGLITGVGSGTGIVSYTVGGCTAIISVEVETSGWQLYGCTNIGIGDTMIFQGFPCSGASGPVFYSGNVSVASFTGSHGAIVGHSAGVTPIYAGYLTGCTSVVWTLSVTSTPEIGPIQGNKLVCLGSGGTLIDAVPGGVWSISDTTYATISDSGFTHGRSATLSTFPIVTYTLGSNYCTTPYRVVPPPAPITLSSPLCVGDSINLTSTALTGSPFGCPDASTVSATFNGFHSSDTNIVKPHFLAFTADSSIAAMNIALDYARLLAPGVVNITYVDSFSYCSVSKTITVNPNPALMSPLSGLASVCSGSAITFTDSMAGGSWYCSDTTIGSVGSVTGVFSAFATGTDTVYYYIDNVCGADTVAKAVSVTPAVGSLSAGILIGDSIVCLGSEVTLTDSSGTTGGAWSVSNMRASCSSGIITGITVGTDTVHYTVSSTCGSRSAQKIIAISPMPVAGSISGDSTLCAASTVTLADSVSGGVWSTADTALAGVWIGVVSGYAAGTVAISYTVSNYCGSAYASKMLTINPLANAGVISGADTICLGGTATLADGAAGGYWVNTDSLFGSFDSSAKILTGLAAGSDTLQYIVTNNCNTAVALHPVYVRALPTAGVIHLAEPQICVGANEVLLDTVSGGVYNTGSATITISADTVFGMSFGAGVVTYTVTDYLCGTAATTINLLVDTPLHASLTGRDFLCLAGATYPVDSTDTLFASPGGGIWTSADTTIAKVDMSGIVRGVSVDSVIITYIVSNVCGSRVAEKLLRVLGTPTAGPIAGPSAVCVGATITLSDSLYNGYPAWADSGSAASVSGSGVVTGLAIGRATIRFIDSNNCGVASVSRIVTVQPLPMAATITGATVVCPGGSTTLNPSPSGGRWVNQGSNATVSGGVVTGVIPGLDSIKYIDSNDCGTATTDIAISVLATPSPVISRTGTLLSVTPASFVSYQWYKDSLVIAGATASTYTLTASDTGFYEVRVTDTAGCYGAGWYYFNGLAVLDVHVPEGILKIFPNPNSGSFSVVLPTANSEYVLTVFDMTGRELHHIQTTGLRDRTINVESGDLAPGTYLLQASSGAMVCRGMFTVVK